MWGELDVEERDVWLCERTSPNPNPCIAAIRHPQCGAGALPAGSISQCISARSYRIYSFAWG